MTIELTPDEVTALRELIERELSDLNPEIRHTNTTAVREQLRAYREALNDLRSKLAAA